MSKFELAVIAATIAGAALWIEQAGYWKTQGFFELKEHAATIGLGSLPIYWYFWKNAQNPEYDSARKWVTVWLAFVCWFNFLVGHVLNNVRGFGS